MDEKVKRPLLKRPREEAPVTFPPPPSAPGRPPVAPPAAKRRRPLAKAFWTIVVLILLAGGGYGIYHLATTQTAPTAQAGRRGSFAGQTSIGAATAVNGTIHVYVNALGTVTPLATVTVVSQIAGQLQQVAFTEGQEVKKGDFLAQIDSRPYEALKAQYEGQLAHDQGVLAQAKADNDRYQTLLKQNSIAKQTADDQMFIVQQDEGTVRVDQAQIAAQALNIAYCHIVSPIDGRVGLRLVDTGNYVQAGSSTGIALLTQVHPISVLFPVAEDDLDEIQPQVLAGTKLQATAFDRANVKQLEVGVVSSLDNQIDTTTGTVKLRALFDNPDNKLFANQFVNIKLLVKTLDNVVTVPGAAIQRGAPGTYVYAIGDDNKVAVRTVTVGPTDGDEVAITKGLAAGDKVVVDGADRLKDGAPVTISALDGKPVAERAKPAAPADGASPNAEHRRRRDQAAPAASGG
jgi:multidrug efflux system membrane fusion protein